METLFFASAFLLFYVYAGYPALLAVLARFAPPLDPDPGYFPTLSILIAAYNEEAAIRQKIEQTLALDYPADRVEILILSDASTDRTDDIVREFNHPRVKLLRMPERRGKTHAQNEGVKHASGHILLFSDATTVYNSPALRYLAARFKEPDVGAATGQLIYYDAKGHSPTGAGTIAFWSYENFIRRRQSRIRTVTGCSGCMYAVRKAAYTPLADDVISDLVQPLWVIKNGYRVVFEEHAVAWEETTTSAGEEFGMRVRVVTRGMRGLLSVPGILNPLKSGWVAFQLWSHKVLRWLVPFFLIGLFVSSAVLAFSRALFVYLLACQLAFYGLALLLRFAPLHRKWKPLGVPLYFCTLNAAALVSVFKTLAGDKFVVWETSRRQ